MSQLWKNTSCVVMGASAEIAFIKSRGNNMVIVYFIILIIVLIVALIGVYNNV
jgi:hypothetical protein